jgi:hypothetical protein
MLKTGAKQEPVLQEPLPGVLDHRMVSRTKVELGRCGACGTGETVGAEKNEVIVVWSANPEQVPERKKDGWEEVKRRTALGEFGLAILCNISASSWPGGFIYRGTPCISPL